jgi:hypothetical protein
MISEQFSEPDSKFRNGKKNEKRQQSQQLLVTTRSINQKLIATRLVTTRSTYTTKSNKANN